jgi:hypothetical protein
VGKGQCKARSVRDIRPNIRKTRGREEAKAKKVVMRRLALICHARQQRIDRNPIRTA